MKITFSDGGWEDYLYWQAEDRKILKRINQLIEDTSRNGNEGIGKPLPLRHEWAGWWSRRITQEHHLVYRVVSDSYDGFIWGHKRARADARSLTCLDGLYSPCCH